MCFFFNDTATTEIYTLSLHDALPIFAMPTTSSAPPSIPSTSESRSSPYLRCSNSITHTPTSADGTLPTASHSDIARCTVRSEEHTSELQSRQYLVCRLLLEKKKKHDK